MLNFTQEQIEAAKAAKSPEELVTMAKEQGQEITIEQAKFFFASQKQGELADEELENVAGGACHNDGWRVVTVAEHHDCFECKHCGKLRKELSLYGFVDYHKCWSKEGKEIYCNCNNCKWCSYEKALWLCKNPANRK